jgi:peptidoglycan/LPS O-acetylase OafA/YrhL
MSQNGLIRLVASREHGVERRVKGASENIAARGERIVRLEACRGIAALVVVFHHIIAAFAPTVSGILAGTRTSDSLAGTVFFVAINGTGAVVLFFVLSGYVLTARFFANPDADFMAIAALKRLPRLALLTTIVTFGSALLFLFGLYHFAEASQVTGSEWLRRFALTDLPNDFQPSLLRALAQGAWLTFTTGESYLDSSLWTMAHELRGSIVVFVAAPFLVFVLWGKSCLAGVDFCLLDFSLC